MTDVHEHDVIQRDLPVAETFWRAAFRVLRAPYGAEVDVLDEVIALESTSEHELYDAISPWEDVGLTRTGIQVKTDGIIAFPLSENRSIRKTCDIPLYFGEKFSLVVACQNHRTRGLVWTSLPTCALTQEYVEWTQSPEVKENFVLRGEPTSIPVRVNTRA